MRTFQSTEVSGIMCLMEMADVLQHRRAKLGMSRAALAEATGIHQRQLARYEAGEQQPSLAVAATLADALDISLDQLAGRDTGDLALTGEWWASWQTSKDGKPRVDTHGLMISQRGDRLLLDADRARPVSEGSYRWRGELRLVDNEALIGWYRSTDQAVRSKGTIYFALHAHGTYAWGRWVGMSYDGLVITGWSGLARDAGHADRIVQRLIETEGASGGSPD